MTAAVDDAVRTRAESAVGQRWPGARLQAIDSLTGHSGLTLRARLSGGDAPAQLVLKCCPPGRRPEGRHDVVRQGRLLSELAATGQVPVPAVLACIAEPPPLVALEWVVGQAEEPVLDVAPGVLPSETVRQRALEATAVLVSLHRLDPADLPSTAREAVQHPADELTRWQPTMATVDEELRPGSDELFVALRRDVPELVGPTVVHGDFRLGNILCEGVDVRAVIDWEIWSVGDPRVDLAWMLVFSSPECLPGVATPIEGMPGPEEVLAAYESGAGHDRTEAMAWFDALARYKMAAIMGNNLRRHRRGNRVDPFQERLVTTIPALIASGLRLLT